MNNQLRALGDRSKERKYVRELAEQINEETGREHLPHLPKHTPQMPPQNSSQSDVQLIYPSFPLRVNTIKPLKLEEYMVLPGIKGRDHISEGGKA